MKRRLWLGAACALFGAACQRASDSLVERAEFGVFFGGQVQQLQEIAKELDPARQQHGIRITFRAPLARDSVARWELSLPVSDKGGPRAALVGEATAKAGQSRLDVPLTFRPADPLGAWHVKVTLEQQLVIDRDFSLVAPPPPPKAAPKPLAPRGPASGEPAGAGAGIPPSTPLQ